VTKGIGAFLVLANKGDQPKERQAAQARKKLLDEELARYVRLLKEHGPPEKVILFGGEIVAKGEVIYEHGGR
jgi:hypothetical protein